MYNLRGHLLADIALFGESRVQRQILERFFSRPGAVRHVRELARELDRSPTIVGAELDRLERTGVLTSTVSSGRIRPRVVEGASSRDLRRS